MVSLWGKKSIPTVIGTHSLIGRMSTSLTLEKAGLQTEIALSPHELFNKLQLEIHTKKMLAVIVFSAFNRLIVGLFFLTLQSSITFKEPWKIKAQLFLNFQMSYARRFLRHWYTFLWRFGVDLKSLRKPFCFRFRIWTWNQPSVVENTAAVLVAVYRETVNRAAVLLMLLGCRWSCTDADL